MAGKVLTDVGLMLQLPTPNVAGQLKVTVPVKPSSAEIVIGPLVPVLPAFTLGNAPDSLKTKLGLSVVVLVCSRMGSTPTVTVAPL